MRITSILIKVLMALTGLAWFGFLVGHLSGNLLLYRGPEAFDAYGRGLHSIAGGGLVLLTEIGLAAFLLTHIVSGIRHTMGAKQARKSGYQEYGRSASTLASRVMFIGGLLIAAFVVVHLYQLRMQWDHASDESLFELTVTTLKNPAVAGFYVLAMVALGFHLSHGFGSAFQTIGLFKPDWRDKLRSAGQVLGWVIAAGFASFPIWAVVR